jgi:hypothetical protein
MEFDHIAVVVEVVAIGDSFVFEKAPLDAPSFVCAVPLDVEEDSALGCILDSGLPLRVTLKNLCEDGVLKRGEFFVESFNCCS